MLMEIRDQCVLLVVYLGTLSAELDDAFQQMALVGLRRHEYDLLQKDLVLQRVALIDERHQWPVVFADGQAQKQTPYFAAGKRGDAARLVGHQNQRVWLFGRRSAAERQPYQRDPQVV